MTFPMYRNGISIGLIVSMTPLMMAVPHSTVDQTAGGRSYIVVDLGLPPGNSRFQRSAAYGIDDAGDVVGTADGNGVRQAFIWRAGKMQLLGTLGGWDSEAWAINSRGEVVGTSATGGSWDNEPWATNAGAGPSATAATASPFRHAFLWRDGTMRDLNAERPRSQNPLHLATASGINDHGQVIGRAGAQAFLWQKGKATTFLRMGDARAINNRGQIVGNVETHVTEVWPLLGLLWENGRTTTLHSLGGNHSFPRAINNNGQIVGWSDTMVRGGRVPFPDQAGCHAVLWDAGQVHDLGTLGGMSSQACAINDGGEIVGWSALSNESPGTLFHDTQLIGAKGRRAFVYSKGKMINLNEIIPADSGWVLEEAWGINQRGQIVGIGTHNGQTRAFLLSRNNDRASEPGTSIQCNSDPSTASSTVRSPGDDPTELWALQKRYDDLS